jgi:hypothetical protein
MKPQIFSVAWFTSQYSSFALVITAWSSQEPTPPKVSEEQIKEGMSLTKRRCQHRAPLDEGGIRGE